jgi:porin
MSTSLAHRLRLMTLLLTPLLIAASPLHAEGTSLATRSTLTGDWNGTRTRLEERGITLAFVTTTEIMRNVSGGADCGTAQLDNEDLQLTVDAEKLVGWPGAQLFVYGLRNGGHSPSEYAGDLQAVSNIDAPSTTKLFEAWLDQSFGEPLSVRAGLYNVNSEFDAKDNAKAFLNSSHGIGREWSQAGLNGPSIFPTTSLTARVRYDGAHGGYALAMVADGVPGEPGNPYGTHLHLSRDDGALLATEWGWASPADDAGVRRVRAGAGAWRFTNAFDHLCDVDASGAPISIRGNRGAYAFVEGTLWRDAARRVAGYARGGVADARVNTVGSLFAGGLVGDGWVPFRSNDRVALGVAIAAHGTDSRLDMVEHGSAPASEIAWELTWQAKVTPWLMLQPDVQIVRNPGADASRRTATLFGLRTVVAY